MATAKQGRDKGGKKFWSQKNKLEIFMLKKRFRT